MTRNSRGGWRTNHDNDPAFSRDRARDAKLAALGWLPIRQAWTHLLSPAEFVTRVHRILARRARLFRTRFDVPAPIAPGPSIH